MHNQEQIACWNAELGRKWAAFHEVLDRMMAPLDEILLARTPVSSRDRVLDIGCGCGATTLQLGRIAGEVLGIDVSAPMLEVAEARATAGRVAVQFLQADAATHPFEPARFDLLVSRFGTMFFQDPVPAFANLRTALRSDGRLNFLCWRAALENPWVTVPLSAALEFVPAPEPPAPGSPGPFAFADIERVRGILEGAGFTDFAAEPVDATLTIGEGASPADQIDFFERIGPMAGALADQPPEVLERVRAALLDALEQHRTDAGVQLGAACWFVSAVNRG